MTGVEFGGPFDPEFGKPRAERPRVIRISDIPADPWADTAEIPAVRESQDVPEGPRAQDPSNEGAE